MQPGRWNVDSTQVVQTRIIVNGVERKGSARIDAQSYEGHPSRATSSPAATCTLELTQPWATTSHAPSPTVATALSRPWPPIAGQPVTVDVGDGVRWWRMFTGRVDATEGSLGDGGVIVECVDESVRLNQRAPREALHSYVAATADGIASGPFDLQTSTLVDHAARAAGFHYRMAPAWDADLFLPMVGSAHPIIGTVVSAATGPDGSLPGRVAWPDSDGWTIGNKRLILEYRALAATPVEITFDLPVRVSSSGWTVVTLREQSDATGAKRGPFLAFDHGSNQIRFGLRTSRTVDVAAVPTSSVAVQGTPIARGAATRVTLRFTPRSPSATQHRFEVRTDAGASEDVTLTDSSGDIAASWRPKSAEYVAGGPMGSMQVVGNPATPYAQMTAPRSARVRYAEVAWLDASRDLEDIQARTLLERVTLAECGAFWVDRFGSLQYTGPLVRESQPVAATLTTDLDVIDWSWRFGIEQRAKTLRLTRTACVTAPSKANTLLWDNSSGSETLVAGDLWEQVVSADADEDWLWVDMSSVEMSSSRSRDDLVSSTTHGATLVNSAGGEAWLAFNLTWGLERLGRRAVKWSARASNSLPSNEAIDLRIPTNAENLPQWWRGKALPRLYGSRIKWLERTTVVETPATTGSEEYEHRVDWLVQNPDRLAELTTLLTGYLSQVMPVFEDVTVRADPRIDVGDRIYLTDKQRSYTRYEAVILAIVSTWEDGKASMSLKVRIVGTLITDPGALIASVATDQTHWLQAQPSWVRAT